MGGNVCNVVKSVAWRTARRRPYCFLCCSKSAQSYLPHHHSRSHSTRIVFLDGLAGVGCAATVEWNAPSLSRDSARDFWRPSLARGIRLAYAFADVLIYSDFASRRAAIFNGVRPIV